MEIQEVEEGVSLPFYPPTELPHPQGPYSTGSHEYGYDFKVIVTNKRASGKKILMYHNGRAAQESVFEELNSQSQMDYIPVRGQLGNELYLLAAVLSHNLNREFQMETKAPERSTTEKRAPLWVFEELRSLRHRLIQRAGKFASPQGRLTLTHEFKSVRKMRTVGIFRSFSRGWLNYKP